MQDGHALVVQERRALLNAASQGIARGNTDLAHLNNEAGIRNYQRMADAIVARLPHGRLLDWGCGYGQMTYLLRQRGMEVMSYDVIKRPHIDELPAFGTLDITYGDDSWRLPYADAAFDAVLSCGTLEHVPEPVRSCQEVARVLRPGGLFFITMLPNRWAAIEALNARLGISDHPVKYSRGTALALLRAAGFDVEGWRHANMLPKNLPGPLARLAPVYSAISPVVSTADRALSVLPLVNTISGTLEIVASKRAR